MISPPTWNCDPIDIVFDAAVVGAGVVGVATAYALARRGARVVLLDRDDAPGRGASFANGGQLSYAYSDPLGSPALLSKLPSLLFGRDPLFRFSMRPDPDLAAWSLRFLQACSPARSRASTIATLELALESQAAMHALLQIHPLRFGHEAAGKMHLYFRNEALTAARKGVDVKISLGVDQHVLTPAEARTLEPALEGTQALTGAIYSPGDEIGDARRFCEELSMVLKENYSVSMRFGFNVADIGLHGEHPVLTATGNYPVRARTVVIAAGAASPTLLKRLNVGVPIQPMKGYSINAPLGGAAPSISLTDTQRRLVFCRLSGGLRVAGGAEVGVADTQVGAAARAALIERARQSMPDAADYSKAAAGWAGLRPMTPTSHPIIRRVGERLVLNVGHGMLGWTLAMGSAERVATIIGDYR